MERDYINDTQEKETAQLGKRLNGSDGLEQGRDRSHPIDGQITLHALYGGHAATVARRGDREIQRGGGPRKKNRKRATDRQIYLHVRTEQRRREGDADTGRRKGARGAGGDGTLA